MEKNTKSSAKFFISHAMKQTLRRKCYFFLCLFACFLVAVVSLISKTVLNQGPIIFMMISEQKSGEIDVLIKTQGVKYYDKNIENNIIYYNSINYTKFVEEFSSKTDFIGNIKDQSVSRISSYAHSRMGRRGLSVLVELNLIDSSKESEIDIGRSYPFNRLQQDECIVHKSIADQLNLTNYPEHVMYLNLNMDVFLENILYDTYYQNKTHPYNNNITKLKDFYHNIHFPCKVIHIISQNYGKTGHDNDKFLIMEQGTFFKHISTYLSKKLIEMFPDFPEILKNLRVSDYSNELIVNFPKPRINSYLLSNMEQIQYNGVMLSNKIMESIGQEGRNHMYLYMPVIDKMKPLFYGSIFLGLILNVIIVILFVLSLILIHSLLVITTESNSFEFGILRMVGTTKKGLIKIIIIQCFFFSIPAFILAYFAHFYVLDFISKILSKYTDNGTRFGQDITSIIFSFIMCNLAPIIAAINPIRNILSKNLSFALNTTLNKSSGVHIEITSAANREINTLVTFGLLTFLYGSSIYYFLPLSLLSINLSLLLAIFLWILIGMMLGLIVLSLNIENIFQKIFTYLFFFWTKAHTKLTILKNLTTHKMRNRQTSMMYALSVGFFIMITVGLDIELKSLTLTRLMKNGAYATLEGRGDYYIRPIDIEESLNLMKQKNIIKDFTFISAELKYPCLKCINRIMNFGKSMDFKVDVVAVSPNFFEVGDSSFLKVDEEVNIDLPLAEKMYSKNNDGRIGISGIFTWEIDAHLEDEFYLLSEKDSKFMPIIFKSSFILHSSPALKMSAEPSTMYQRSIIIPIHTYIDIVNKCWSYFAEDLSEFNSYSFDDFPIGRILLSFHEDVDPETIMGQINDIVWRNPNYVINTWYYWESDLNMDKIKAICNVIFYGVSIVILFFCYFNLSASMTINISEQKKEIAIFRALGMTANHLTFIYIAESFILIFCASFMGLLIGTIMSWTMTLQRIIFTNLPLHFIFPKYELSYITIASILGGIFSTLVPAKVMLRTSISNLIRN